MTGEPNPIITLSISPDLLDKFPSDQLELSVASTLIEILDELLGFAPKSPLELSLTVTNDAAIKQMNAEHRGKDTPTDVLSFPQITGLDQIQNSTADDPPVSLGDIVISYEKISAQSLDRDLEVSERFVECLVHGILHLLGYDHIDDEDRIMMEGIEDILVPKTLGFFAWVQ